MKPGTKDCYGKCERCVWFRNGGCSEWIRKDSGRTNERETD